MIATANVRPLKGSRISSFYPIKSVPHLASLDSAFQLQEFISILIRHDIHDVDTIVTIPELSKDNAEEEKDGREVNVDEACWIYEQLRRLAQDLSHPLITMLQQECNRQSCPEMKAGEWLYLCVAHGNEGSMEQCCAIDYILHTVDSATALLNSPRAFPSRLSIPPTSNRHFSSLARRLGRIFAHAFFHHREIFEQAEAESSLYARFLALTSRFDLVPPEFLVIPPRMHPEDAHSDPVEPPRLLAAAVEPNTQPSEPEPAPEPRKSRNRTDTMVFSEAYSYVEEIAKNDMSGSGEPSTSSTEREQELQTELSLLANDVSPEDQAPNVSAPMELEDSGVPLPSHEPEDGEGLHPSAVELPESLVDPALAREPEEAAPHPDLGSKEDSGPESRDVTDHQEAAEKSGGADSTAPGEANALEHDGEEADVTDEPLHEESGASEHTDVSTSVDTTQSV